MRPKDEPTEGIFYCIDKNGQPTDEGLIDEMLENDEEITRQLIEAGIIKNMRITAKEAGGE